MKQKSKIFYIILVFALILGGVYWLISKNINKYRPHSEQVSQSEAADLYEYQEISSAEGGQASTDIAGDSPQVSTDINEYQTYTNSTYNFSFKYPEGFTVANFQEGEYGETILVRKKEGKESLQIFISPFDEPSPLTKERILEDLPDMLVENAQQRLLKNGAVGLIFFSQESSLGRTREVWFVHNGYLYQVSTYAELDSWLAGILATWRFH